MSSSEDSFSEDDEDYVPEETFKSDDDDADDQDDLMAQTTSNEADDQQLKNGKDQIDELWKNFKNDVTQKEKTKTQKEINGFSLKTKEIETRENKANNQPHDDVESDQKHSDTVTITKVYDFAGEEVKVTKEVKKNSAEAIKHFQEQSSTAPAKAILGRPGVLKKKAAGGISGVLGRLGKKPKLSTLEKSKLDWKRYKEDEGIEDELQAYNKGKEGYLEKVSFLERTEMRQFERERDLRLKQSSKR